MSRESHTHDPSDHTDCDEIAAGEHPLFVDEEAPPMDHATLVEWQQVQMHCFIKIQGQLTGKVRELAHMKVDFGHSNGLPIGFGSNGTSFWLTSFICRPRSVGKCAADHADMAKSAMLTYKDKVAMEDASTAVFMMSASLLNQLALAPAGVTLSTQKMAELAAVSNKLAAGRHGAKKYGQCKLKRVRA